MRNHCGNRTLEESVQHPILEESFPCLAPVLGVRGPLKGVMATDGEKREYLRTSVEAHLTFLWTEAEVSLNSQHAIAVSGFRSVQKFTSIADDRASLRRALLADYGLDPAAGGAPGTAARIEVASIICAWESASEVRSAAVASKAEAQAQGLPKPLSMTEKSSMRKAFEAIHGKLPSCEVPSGEYLSSKLEEAEQEEPSASPLDEVMDAEGNEAADLSASLDAGGRLRLVRKKVKGKAPMTSEELRIRLRVECHTWAFIALKYTTKTWLQSVTPSAWQRYADYLLGPMVADLKVPSLGVGEKMADVRVPWAIILHYELEIRKHAFAHVRDSGATIDASLARSMRDPELKEVHFTSPLALMGRRRLEGKEEEGGRPPKRPRGGKGKEAKGKGKGKESKGKGKGSLLSTTADGRQICFNFNTAGGCKTAACTRVHICRIKGCGSADHGMHDKAAHPSA